jgi:hypothetical protein
MLSWRETEGECAALIVALDFFTVDYNFVDAEFEFERRVVEVNLKLPNLKEMVVLNRHDFECKNTSWRLHLVE